MTLTVQTDSKITITIEVAIDETTPSITKPGILHRHITTVGNPIPASEVVAEAITEAGEAEEVILEGEAIEDVAIEGEVGIVIFRIRISFHLISKISRYFTQMTNQCSHLVPNKRFLCTSIHQARRFSSKRIKIISNFSLSTMRVGQLLFRWRSSMKSIKGNTSKQNVCNRLHTPRDPTLTTRKWPNWLKNMLKSSKLLRLI